MNQNTLLIVYVAVMLGAMYFLFIAPQRKQRKQLAEMMAALQPGDEIITAGGLYGTLRSIEDDSVTLEVAEGVVIRVAKGAIAARKPDEKPGR